MSDPIVERIDGLAAAVAAARGRLDPRLLEAGDRVVEQARVRVRLSSRYTVVGLAGATGSGKSSLFNHLCGLDLAAVGVKRPTTSWALSCSWSDGAEALLEWLGVPPRHQVSRASSLDASDRTGELSGLVLLDLPDHDSTEVSHHLEVQRLVGLADLLIWVLDPQKYADAAIHDRFLKPLASHRDVMLVVFNHVDELDPPDRDRTLTDVRRVLAGDGLADIPVLVTSASTGEGVELLREAVAGRVREKSAHVTRLEADIRTVATRLGDAAGPCVDVGLDPAARDRLMSTSRAASGADTVLDRGQEALRTRGRIATRWLSVARWRGGATAGAPATGVDEPALAGGVRAAAEAATVGMPRSWRDSVRSAATARVPQLAAALHAGLAEAGTTLGSPPRWWTFQRLLQWLFLLVGIGGLVLIGVDAAAGRLGDRHQVAGLPVGSLLLAGGVLVSLLIALGSRLAVERSVRRLRAAADRVVDDTVAGAVGTCVVQPLDRDLDGFRSFHAAVATARSD